ncbi:hypothetical protein NEISUBOT_03552 [Neisseria subflava NJ9703]|uniref:Uncharacterized protein n=1 Tax=Neisseria subflava NJ9703 TaxID=546268 RepID=A0A9W5MZW7_NEISU|nr:hypothetical protein NEISUBOT_03552 [Neisseria subflava NJ9703]
MKTLWRCKPSGIPFEIVQAECPYAELKTHNRPSERAIGDTK